MNNKLKSVRRGSKSAASPQSKTTQSKAKVRHETGLPFIALFPKGEANGIADELVDLTKAEYAALKQAAEPSGSGVLMFTANAALEKAHRLGAVVVGRRHDCLCMYQCGPFAGEFPLLEKLLPSATGAACHRDMTVDQFIADAISEKLGKARNKTPIPPASQTELDALPKTREPVKLCAVETSQHSPSAGRPSRVITSTDIEHYSRMLASIATNLDSLHVAWNALYHHAATHGGGADGDGIGGEAGRTMSGLWSLLCDHDESTYSALGSVLMDWDEVLEPTLGQLFLPSLPSRKAA
jgi:hypothetical protein